MWEKDHRKSKHVFLEKSLKRNLNTIHLMITMTMGIMIMNRIMIK